MRLGPSADGDWIDDLVARPGRGITGLLRTMVRTRGQVALALERGTTMSALASALADQNRSASVTAREADGSSWSITFGSTEETEVSGTVEASRA